MRKTNGSSLVEYALPLALIGLVVGLGLFYLSSGDKFIQFITSTSDVKYDSTTQKAVFNKNLEPAALINDSASEDPPENMLTDCINGECTLDLGSIVLTGIPENFNEFIETAGASGGSDKVSELMSQIAQQLEAEGLKKESEQVKKLAVMGHNIAVMQKSIEELVNSCNNDAACINNAGNNVVPKPDGYDETYYPYDASLQYKDFAGSTNLGGIKNLQMSDFATYTEMLSRDKISAEFINTLDSINSNNGISQDVKNIIQELSWDIGVIGEDFQNNVEFIAPEWFDKYSLLSPGTFFDPITLQERVEPIPQDPISNFNNYKASKITHFDSALICVSGENTDSGTSCH